MDAQTLLDALTQRGATVTVRGDVLNISPRAIIDDELRAEIRANKTELQVLAGPKNAPETPPASTCTGNRVALPGATAAQIDGITTQSYADAELLRRRLVSAGVILKVENRFGCDRLCVEWRGKLARDDWLQVLAARAELSHMLTTKRPYIAEATPSELYEPAEARENLVSD